MSESQKLSNPNLAISEVSLADNLWLCQAALKPLRPPPVNCPEKMIRCHSKRTPGLGAPNGATDSHRMKWRNIQKYLKVPNMVTDWWHASNPPTTLWTDGIWWLFYLERARKSITQEYNIPAGNQALARQRVWQCALCPTIANSCRFSPFAHGCHLWSPGHRDCTAVLRRLSMAFDACLHVRLHEDGTALLGQLLQNQFHNHLEPINVTWEARDVTSTSHVLICRESEWHQCGMR